MPEEEPLSLPECEARLKVLMGEQAPALATLKRWSSEGTLRDARVGEARGRPRFKFDVVASVAKSAAKASTSRHAKRARIKSAERAGASELAGEEARLRVLDGEDVREITQAVRDSTSLLGTQLEEQIRKSLGDIAVSEAVLAAVQEAMSRISKDLGKAIAAVDGLGKMLMMKYDAETTELKRVVAEQRAEIQELKRSASGIEAAKVAALLSRVSDQLNSMRTP